MQQTIYQLKLTLRGIRPPIWRRIETPATVSLFDLHRTLQAAMGWTDTHLHQYIQDGVYYGPPDREFGQDIVSERRTLLKDVLNRPKARLLYEYDFGDGWEHDVILEAIIDADPAAKYPRVTGGRRSCPPEDSGGPYRYPEIIAALDDARHPEHESMREWVGEHFAPERFDLVTANDRLSRRRASSRRDAYLAG